MRRLNGVDALMLYLDGGSAYNHTLKISVLDPSTDPDGWSWPKARRMFEERAHLLPVFRLRGIPGVREVAVIGVSDEKWGEVACAIVVADQNEVSEQQIVEFCGTRLARYKLPRKVIFADAIPHNPTGKIPKRVLREQYSVTLPT